MQCKKCGSHVGLVDKFCPGCGNDLTKINLGKSTAKPERNDSFNKSVLNDAIKESVTKELDEITRVVSDEINKAAKELSDDVQKKHHS